MQADNIIFITMHMPYSEVHAFKKPQANASVRVTINPQPDIDANNNQTNKQTVTKQKSFSIMSNKNYQYFSTSVLPSYLPLQHINNCEISNSIQNNNLQQIFSHDIKSSQSLSKRVKKGQVLQQKLKIKKDSMPNQNTNNNETLLHHKSNSKLNSNNMRQTTSPNYVSLLPKHKQPEWMQKIESYSKNSNNMKMNNSHRPYDIHKQPYLKIQQQQKSSVHNQNNHLRIYTHQNLKDQSQNGCNTSTNKKTFFRQTLDPHFQRNLLDSTDLKNQGGGAYPFFKKVERQFKDLSGNKMEKNFRTEIKNENKSTHLKTNFWRHKMLLSPQNLKPQTPHKPQFGLSKDLSIPLLPLHTSQKQSNNKPSFFLQKKSLSRFSIMKQIGTGTYNDAFLCMDKKTNAIFCMKKYHKSTIKSFPNVLQHFIKKISFQLLIDDPNVVQLYHVFADGDHVYTIEEFMEGGRLIDCFQREVDAREAKRRQTQNFISDVKDSNQQLLLSQSRIIDRIYDIASALKHMHHCQDLTLKPENIRRSKLPPMVHGDIRTKSILMSMGVCKIPSIEPANTKLLCVNQYSPPQLIIEKIFIPKSDIWNLGLVLYELCAEKKLFSNKDLGEETEREIGGKSGYQIFNVNIYEQIDKLSGTTALVKDLMRKMLSIQPENRPNASEILSSNVFRMYGLDVQWKQRRNQKIMKQKDVKDLQKIQINKTAPTQTQQHEQQMLSIDTPGKKQLTLPNNTTNTNKSNSPCTNLSFSRDSNSNYTYDETQIEVLSLVKPHWTQKTKNEANKGKDERNKRQLN